MLDKFPKSVEPIRDAASAWRAASHRVAKVTAILVGPVNEVDKKWEGESADAFNVYIRKYPKAGEDFNKAVDGDGTALTTAADALTTAKGQIETIVASTIKSANAHIAQYQKDHPDQAPELAWSSVDKDTKIITDALALCKDQVTKAEAALTTATTSLTREINYGFFEGIPQPGGADFDPGEKKIVWTKTPYDPKTETQGGGGGGGNGSGGGSGSGGGGNGGGGAPAPKEEVVKWIKEALTIIKSPEMARVMRERGIDVSDLDPNDENDIKRIWTIIYHESGGNPNSINNWDINAKNGVPSQGLMQTIPPTFNAHALPGHKTILNPVDNIIAGVLYTYDRYGNLGKHPGISSLESGGGYKPY